MRLGKSRTDSCDPKTNGEHNFAEQIAGACRTIFDVGARTDDYFVHLNQRCQYHLFEPMANSFSKLKQKVGALPNVHLVNTALGSQQGTLRIHPDTQSIHKRPHGSESSQPIKIQRLDDYCQANEIREIDFLKIDVEGHEYEVMQGGENMIRNGVSMLQFEYGGTYREVGMTLANVFAFLGPKWFFYRITHNGLIAVETFTNKLETYRYANYVAARRPLNHCLRSHSSLVSRWFRRQ